MGATVITGKIFAGQSVTLLARVAAGGINVVQSDFGTITYEIWRVYPKPAPANDWAEQSPPEKLTQNPVSVTVANAVYNTLQTDGRWTQDSTGYNFALAIPGSSIPLPDSSETYNRLYEIPVQFTPSVGNPFGVLFRLEQERFLYGAPG